MGYSPKGLYVWDAWFMPRNEEIHCYHLQRRRPGSDITEETHDRLGHAVTTDLIDWEERPPTLGPNPKDSRDDDQPWTGCALWHEGRGYLYYTMRGSNSRSRHQLIGLATTEDPDRWDRYPGNPVIAPDPRWYANAERPVSDVVDCRDMIVHPDPKGGWFGFYATRRPGRELPETSVIACAHSDDLIRWEQRPPIFAPTRYACIEVPDVFEMNGRWYLTCLTGNVYGNRGVFDDPNLNNGTIYAVSDRIEGPYEELKDNGLVAARTSSPISCRSVPFKGGRYLFYTDRERSDLTDHGDVTFGTLTTPKLLKTDGERLYAAYSPLIEKKVSAELIGEGKPLQARTGECWGQIWPLQSARWSVRETISGDFRTGWSVLPLSQRAESYILEATIHLEDAVAAGFGLRMTDFRRGAVVALDAEAGTVFFADAPMFEFAERRVTPIRRKRPMHLKVVNRLEHVEVYVDDDLRLAFSRYDGIGGEVGLFVDRGTARFENLRMRALDMPRRV